MRLKALACGAAVLSSAATAFSAPTLTLRDLTGDPYSASAAPGSTFSVDLWVKTDVGTSGISYYLKTSAPNVCTLTSRTMVDFIMESAYPTLGLPVQLTTSPSAQDVGAGQMDTVNNKPAGEFTIATLVFMVASDAKDNFTISTINSSMTDVAFASIGVTEGVYTVVVPEPTGIGFLSLFSLLLGRRRRV